MDRPTPIDEPYTFKDGLIVSSTDLKGIITYANRKFCEIAGYTKQELQGKNHNIVRHPDMPKAAFQEVWDTIKAGKDWTGLVKNLRKDGLYYWADTEILPIRDEDENITGYISVRKVPSRKDIDETIELYAKMRETED